MEHIILGLVVIVVVIAMYLIWERINHEEDREAFKYLKESYYKFREGVIRVRNRHDERFETQEKKINTIREMSLQKFHETQGSTTLAGVDRFHANYRNEWPGMDLFETVMMKDDIYDEHPTEKGFVEIGYYKGIRFLTTKEDYRRVTDPIFDMPVSDKLQNEALDEVVELSKKRAFDAAMQDPVMAATIVENISHSRNDLKHALDILDDVENRKKLARTYSQAGQKKENEARDLTSVPFIDPNALTPKHVHTSPNSCGEEIQELTQQLEKSKSISRTRADRIQALTSTERSLRDEVRELNHMNTVQAESLNEKCDEIDDLRQRHSGQGESGDRRYEQSEEARKACVEVNKDLTKMVDKQAAEITKIKEGEDMLIDKIEGQKRIIGYRERSLRAYKKRLFNLGYDLTGPKKKRRSEKR